ncbi:MAG: YkgJ family cysteine cluster protein [Sandaracinus sp.]|nr:YkgJ family cysteine cluster protein [Sandaracinus sp.]MCB9634187.1 YkgJ family cysteine cluster protein [Sandaracinus sp.]
MDPLDAYRGLRARVDAHERAAFDRGADLRCGAGCEACCHVELEVAPIEAADVLAALEALSDEALADLASRLPREDGRCVMLDDAGRCDVYEVRPLVCRSQGMALAYPDDLIPVEAVRARAGDKALVWCPLNFTERPPTGPDVLDAGRLDEALALLNRAFVGSGDPLERVALRDLVALAAQERTLG